MVRTLLTLLLAVPLQSQTFEVASIRPSQPLTDVEAVGIHVDGAQVRYTSMNLRYYIRTAFRLRDYQLEAPEWLTNAIFDIRATLPAGSTPANAPEMLQALLADRFHLRAHHETRQFPVYALVVSPSGHKLKELPPNSTDDSTTDLVQVPVNVTAVDSRAGTTVSYGHGAYFYLTDTGLACKRMTMPFVADMLAKFMDRPIVDATGLEGAYDFSITIPEEDFSPMKARAASSYGFPVSPERLAALSSSGAPLSAALRPLGLKLESRKAPIDIVVIDHLDKSPSDN